MDKKLLLSDEVQAFIREHEDDDLNKLLLQRERFSAFPLTEIVNQIKSRKKAKRKLPTWYKQEKIIYPTAVSVEQASSEQTARFKASLYEGDKGLDLTGGMGVDSYYLSRRFNEFTYVESNATLTELAKHNFTVLGANNIRTKTSIAEDFLPTSKDIYDLIFIDPDRRPNAKRVVSFSESTPDVPQLLGKLKAVSRKAMIKASPMMDIRLGMGELSHVASIVIISVNNEVKELLYCLDFTRESKPECRCVNITSSSKSEFIFSLDQELQEKSSIEKLQKYLYEPNAGILKAGGFNSVASRFGIAKLHPNTHLYTAHNLLTNFPGRTFKVLANINYSKKELSGIIDKSQANLSVRNFVDTPQQMKKKLKLKDGGNTYIFGYRDSDNRNKLAVCSKI